MFYWATRRGAATPTSRGNVSNNIILQCGAKKQSLNKNKRLMREAVQTAVVYSCLRNWDTMPHFLLMNLRKCKAAPHKNMQRVCSPEAVRRATEFGSGVGPENCGGPGLDEYYSIRHRSELHDWSRPNEDLREKEELCESPSICTIPLQIPLKRQILTLFSRHSSSLVA